MAAFVGSYPMPNQSFGQQPAMFEAPIPVPATTNPNQKHGSRARRGSLHRSMSFDPSQSLSKGVGISMQQALVSFDPYASGMTETTASMTTVTDNVPHDPFAPPPAAAPPMAPQAYSNYSLPVEANPYAVAPMNPFDQSTISDITTPAANDDDDDLFADFNASVQAQPKPKDTQSVLQLASKGDFSEESVDPALIAEQKRVWDEIQRQQRHQAIVPHTGKKQSSRALVPSHNKKGTSSRAMVVKSMPVGQGHRPSNSSRKISKARSLSPKRCYSPRGGDNSIANGGVAILDPKKDKRQATRHLKTTAGAIGGAVVGGLVLAPIAPIGVALGASVGGAASNKMAKARDNRKQAQFEQRNFQKQASKSHAAKKGASCFV